MNLALKTEMDFDGLNQLISGLMGALIGSGQGAEGDASRLIKNEAAQLAWEIGNSVGPKTEEDGKKSVEDLVRRFLFPGPDQALPMEKQGADGSIRWLSAGPRFLTVVKTEDIQTASSVDSLIDQMRKQEKEGGRGIAWVELKSRGKQHIMWIRRVVTTKEKYESVQKKLRLSMGKLRASFCYAAVKLGIKKRIPRFVERHIESQASGNAIFSDRLDGESPYIEFGSRSKGVQSNPILVDKISRAIENRKYITIKKIQNVASGYTYNWNTGQVFKPTPIDEN